MPFQSSPARASRPSQGTTPAGTGRPSCSRARGARSFTQALGIKARVLLRGL